MRSIHEIRLPLYLFLHFSCLLFLTSFVGSLLYHWQIGVILRRLISGGQITWIQIGGNDYMIWWDGVRSLPSRDSNYGCLQIWMLEPTIDRTCLCMWTSLTLERPCLSYLCLVNHRRRCWHAGRLGFGGLLFDLWGRERSRYMFIFQSLFLGLILGWLLRSEESLSSDGLLRVWLSECASVGLEEIFYVDIRTLYCPITLSRIVFHCHCKFIFRFMHFIVQKFL